MTFIAMNRFRVALGRRRNSKRSGATARAICPPRRALWFSICCAARATTQATLFVSHTIWETRGHFEDWTRSEAFRRAHSGAPKSVGLYLGPPQFEGFEAVAETICPA